MTSYLCDNILFMQSVINKTVVAHWVVATNKPQMIFFGEDVVYKAFWFLFGFFWKCDTLPLVTLITLNLVTLFLEILRPIYTRRYSCGIPRGIAHLSNQRTFIYFCVTPERYRAVSRWIASRAIFLRYTAGQPSSWPISAFVLLLSCHSQWRRLPVVTRI